MATRSTADPRRPRRRLALAAEHGLDRSSAFRSASLTVTDGVVSGGGKTVKYSDLLGGKMFNADDCRRADGLSRDAPFGAPGTPAPLKPVTPATRSSDEACPGSTSRRRWRAPTPTSRTFAFPECCMAAGRPRGRLPLRTPRRTPAASRLSVDESSIAHIPGAQIVAGRQLPRRRCADGVRRDPGCCPAEGQVGHEAGFPARRAATSGRLHEGDADTNTGDPA